MGMTPAASALSLNGPRSALEGGGRMASMHERTSDWLDSLGELDPYATVLAGAALELAASIDNPPETQSGMASIAPYVNSLRVTMEKLREAASADEDNGEGGWTGLTVVPGGA